MTNFVFQEVNGELELVGDWDNLYNSELDPWGQSCSADSVMKPFYIRSRSKIIDLIKQHQFSSVCKILEVGCGLGFFTQQLKSHLPSSIVSGSDVSDAAVRRASLLFPDTCFFQGDIRKQDFSKNISAKYDVILLNQLLWYVVDELDQVLLNTSACLVDSTSFVVLSQAFPRLQRYGKTKLDGFEGAVRFFKTLKFFELIECSYVDDASLPHVDVHFVLRPSKPR
jgi:SAM-dependent methyltransferase